MILEFPSVPETIRLLRTGRETGGELLELEDYFPAGAGHRGPPLHWHPGQEESFEVLEGSMWVRVDREERILGPGETITVPPRVPHTFGNATPGALRQMTRFRPALRMEEFFRVASGLAKDGRTDARGFPGLLHVAVLARDFRYTMVLASPPQPVQLIVFGALAPVGRLLGHVRLQASYLVP